MVLRISLPALLALDGVGVVLLACVVVAWGVLVGLALKGKP